MTGFDRSKMHPDHIRIADIHEAKWPQAKRDEYKQAHPENFAGPGTSFPIEDAEDVHHAAALYGHAEDPDSVKSKIIKIAKENNLAHALPQEWKEDAEGDENDDLRNDLGDLTDTSDFKDDPGQGTYSGSVKESIILTGRICEDQPDAAALTGAEIRVTVLKGGKSTNGYYYNQDALQQVARMIEGARAYADHGRTAADDQVRSIRDMIGFYKNAQYIPPHTPENPLGRVDATLHILEAAQWLRSMVKEALSLGKPDLIGLSVDIFGTWQHSDSHQAKDVTRVLSLNSCDVVTRPSAGGSFQRILHSDPDGAIAQPRSSGVSGSHFKPLHSHQQGASMDPKDKKKPESSQTQDPPATTSPADSGAARITEDVSAELARLREAQTTALADLNKEQDAAKALREEQARILEQAKLDRCEALLERKLAATNLPDPVRAGIREQYAGRIFEASDLDTSIESMRKMMAGLVSSNIIRGHNFEKVEVGQQITEAEKLQVAFDLMFEGLTPGDDVKMLTDSERAKFAGVRGFNSIREAYYRVTGDESVAGAQLRELGMIRVSEHAPIARITEADTTTASFSYLLGTSMNKRLLKDYQAWPAEWQKFTVITPIKDFKQQTRVRLGAFGSLSTVPEDNPYTTVSLTDSAATYVATKRGNLVTVSRETIINDDLFAIRQIPTKLAVAAAYTLAEFVYGFLSTNPNIYDGNALFTSGAPHSNLGSSALSSAAMQAGVTAMREQTNFAGKRLGLRPSYLIVPPELEFTAMVVTKSAGVPGSANNDINPMLGYVQPIVSPQLSNTSQWFFSADPKTIDTIEVGFVGGQVNPALFIQDQPLFGLNFTQDVISYKIRHEYGGAVLDYRGLYRGI